eukprot:863050-Pelagomonas_calceolata.AAC.2
MPISLMSGAMFDAAAPHATLSTFAIHTMLTFVTHSQAQSASMHHTIMTLVTHSQAKSAMPPCRDYPAPIVDHAVASKECIARMGAAYKATNTGGSAGKASPAKAASSGRTIFLAALVLQKSASRLAFVAGWNTSTVRGHNLVQTGNTACSCICLILAMDGAWSFLLQDGP